MNYSHFPSPAELERTDILTFDAAYQGSTKIREDRTGTHRFLVEHAEFVEFVHTSLKTPFNDRLLQKYLDLKLIPPPFQKQGKNCFVIPEHYELVAVLILLRTHFNLPLREVRALMEHLPHERYHLVIEQKLSLNELLELTKSLPRGFVVGDLFMAKACDLMIEDLLSSNAAAMAATEPGDALRRMQEERILARLGEIKDWVVSGRREKFVAREAAEDFVNFARNQLVAKRIVTKLTARKDRLAKEGRGS